ncbi:MAG: hypothetical protein KKG01_03065 [Candidatus Omnitrophica bacterium]|nr:hypothetical protein [Candidatus Omnitrophota bacterium]
MVITVLVILACGFAARSIGEERVAGKERDSIQAFWLAEAGLDRAISEIPDTPLSGTLDTGNYSTTTSATSSPLRFLVVSTGGVPYADTSDPSNITRTIRAIVEQPASDSDPSGITSAITASGDVTVRGSAEVDGDIDANAVFDFEDVFGISKDAMQDNATNLYTNPENNVTPVTDITWANVDSGDEMIISASDWQGSGILVVNGDARITGGDFSGIIWVIGSLWISGSPDIEGAIFVESGAEFDTTVTGSADIEYDSEAIGDAFGSIPSDLPPQIISWKED